MICCMPHQWYKPTSHFFSTTRNPSDIFYKITFLSIGKNGSSHDVPPNQSRSPIPLFLHCLRCCRLGTTTSGKTIPGINTASSISEAVTDSQLIVYAIKPQNVDKVNAEIWRTKSEVGCIWDDATILSVASGKPIGTFVMGSGIERVARSVPSTPAQIGAGVTVWSCTDDIDSNDRKKIKCA
ncbi:hypothetical protein HJC23_002262 [Cyclotella cryptica]|uniref:Uncharacterized protein n=1 Tax=Cyclotella cryptica TaxID=29204 RepID=A0ABD3QFH1_9STRA